MHQSPHLEASEPAVVTSSYSKSLDSCVSVMNQNGAELGQLYREQGSMRRSAWWSQKWHTHIDLYVIRAGFSCLTVRHGWLDEVDLFSPFGELQIRCLKCILNTTDQNYKLYSIIPDEVCSGGTCIPVHWCCDQSNGTAWQRILWLTRHWLLETGHE